METSPVFPEMEKVLWLLASPPQVCPSDAVPQCAWFGRWKVSVPNGVPDPGVGVLVGVAVGVGVGVLVGVAVGIGVGVGVLVGVGVGVGVGEPDPPGTSPWKEVTVAVPFCVRKRIPQ